MSVRALYERRKIIYRGSRSRYRIAYRVQRAAYCVQRTAYRVQRTADRVQRPAYSVQHTAYSVKRAAVSSCTLFDMLATTGVRTCFGQVTKDRRGSSRQKLSLTVVIPFVCNNNVRYIATTAVYQVSSWITIFHLVKSTYFVRGSLDDQRLR